MHAELLAVHTVSPSAPSLQESGYSRHRCAKEPAEEVVTCPWTEIFAYILTRTPAGAVLILHQSYYA